MWINWSLDIIQVAVEDTGRSVGMPGVLQSDVGRRTGGARGPTPGPEISASQACTLEPASTVKAMRTGIRNQGMWTAIF